jgi:arylsulfatase A-like enzyme
MGSALFGKTPASSTPEARPNIVFFLGEGARWDESSLAGNSLLKTPHIDRIGREGALFRNAFCINSLCLPARATILSGLYSHTSGAVDNQHSKVPKKFPIVTDLIRNGGYEITFIGKSHVEGALMDRLQMGFTMKSPCYWPATWYAESHVFVHCCRQTVDARAVDRILT